MELLNAVDNPMKYVSSLLTTATITVILMSNIAPAQAQELAVASMGNSVIVQHSLKSFNQQLESAPPPPDGRKPEPAGSRISPKIAYVEPQGEA